jgi:CHAP domain
MWRACLLSCQLIRSPSARGSRVLLLLLLGTVFGGATVVASPGLARASQTDCLSYGYACTPGYTGANAAGTWAWSHYGASYAQTANGYHNCTLYAAWRLEQNGMGDPGNWGNAVDWASHNGGGDNTPAVGVIAWWGSETGGGLGHVAYVDQVSGGQVHVMRTRRSVRAS